MAINSSAEYWGGSASLIHTDPLGTADTPPPEETRIYHVAGTQHVAGPWPVDEAGIAPLALYPTGRHPLSPVQVWPLMRAFFAAMDAWLRDGTLPPPSAYPRIADGTLVPLDEVQRSFPAIPGVSLPSEIGVPHVLDYGPRWSEGIIDREPPALGPAYRPLVPSVNADGNEPGGIQPVELAVPLATYTGWNLRHPDAGNPEQMVAMLGSYLPFPAGPAEAAATGDPRPPISRRYRDREDYLRQVDAAIAALVERRLVLSVDAPSLRHRAEQQWQAHAAPIDSAVASVD
jgi:hypothetical protein